MNLFIDPDHDDSCETYYVAYRNLSKLNEAACSVLDPYPLWNAFVCEYKLKVVIKQSYLGIGFFMVRNM